MTTLSDQTLPRKGSLTAHALPAIVAGLRARGLRPVRLSTLLARGA
jgi:hypothetical protein